MDRAAGVLIGQLGIQARYVDYAQYLLDTNGNKLEGKSSYEITVPKDGLMRNDDGYWSLTIYNTEDRYLIPNKENKYVLNFYNLKPNEDGTYTLRVNANGEGENAIPTKGKDFYGVFRVYEPVDSLIFPEIKKVN
jgi:hypothetical protein